MVNKMETYVIQSIIGYTFQDKSLLDEALTHSSYVTKAHSKIRHNERLEFLGDAVLGLFAGSYIFKTFPNMSEGEMSRLRSLSVCEDALYRSGKEIQLGKYMRFGKSEEKTGANKPSIIADAMEALIAAIYLDGGFAKAEDFVLKFIVLRVAEAATGNTRDDKTQLQELLQKDGLANIRYKMTGEHGPDHEKWFDVQVSMDDKVLGLGSGRSKKEAEQAAARAALDTLLA